MPHYKDGSAVKIGDIVKGPAEIGEMIGAVVKIQPGSDTCNMRVLPLAFIVESDNTRVAVPTKADSAHYATCKEFLKIAALLLAVLIAGTASAQDPPAKPQVDASEVGRWGDRVTVTGEGPRDGGEQLFSAAMSAPADDSGRWYVTVWGTSKDAGSLALVKAFERDAALSPFVADPPTELKRQPWAHFNFYQADDRTQQWRFADAQIPLAGPFPIVTIQPPRNGSFGGMTSVPGKNSKAEARCIVIDRIEAGELKDPPALGKRIRSSVQLYCEKLAKSGFRPPADLVAHVLEPRGLHQQGGSHSQNFPWGPQTPPAVPAFNPQWPPGGPAADTGASIEQLQAVLPGAPADFILAQFKQKATLEAALAAWRILQAQTNPTPPTVQPAPSSSLGAIVAGLLALFGVTNFVSIAISIWAVYRSSRKAQGKDLVIPDDIFEALKIALATVPKKA